MSSSFNKDILVDQFISKLKRRQIVGSSKVALETAHLLRLLVSQARWQTADSVLSLIREVGQKIINAQRLELAVGNIIRRVLKLIRDEYRSIPEEGPALDHANDTGSSDDEKTLKPSRIHGKRVLSSSPGTTTDSSMYNLLANAPNFRDNYNYDLSKYSLKPLIIQGINELIDEVENSRTNIASQSLDHIHTNETIMTIGRSKTVEDFLLSAARKRPFSVVIAETAPLYDGHILASNLAKNENITVTVVPDCAIDAMMNRVNKVILGCHAVMANGGLLAVTGSQLMATCANHHSTPVVVTTGIYKLSPAFPSDRELYYDPISPSSILDFDTEEASRMKVVSPYYDYVDPNSVSLFITNVGGHPPTYLYRLLGEFYDSTDDDWKSI